MQLLKYISFLLIIFMVGCAGHGKKGLFGKESDTLIKSACDNCEAALFYVNGRWLE
jgi:hypothetical protein